MISYGDAPWLDRAFKLSSKFDPFVSSLAEKVVGSTRKRRKKDGIRNIETALSVILANLLRQSALAPSVGVRVSLKNDGYPKGPFNPYCLGIRAVSAVIEYLSSPEVALVQKRGGNYDKERGRGYPTEISSSNSLKKLLNREIELIISNISKPILVSNSRTITRNTFDVETYLSHRDVLFDQINLPLIRLRDTSSKKGGGFVDFDRTPEIDCMEAKLGAFNSFLASHGCLNLFVTDDELEEVLKGKGKRLDDFGHPDSDNYVIDLVSGNKLYRVFNDRRIDHGGRFYGAWWENLRKRYRQKITVNGSPTVEIDFSGIHLAMLYAKVGEQLESDPYAIDGIGSEYRPLIKRATNAMINARSRVDPPKEFVLPEGLSWSGLQDAILARHKPIAKFFRSGEGVRLQRVDSDIAENVMHRMMDKGIIILPVHDSFIVVEEHADLLTATMKEAYQQKMEGCTIPVKRSQSLVDDLLANKGGLSGEERRETGRKLFEAEKAKPEYEGYRRREELLASSKSAFRDRDIDMRQNDQTETAIDIMILGSGPRVAQSHSGTSGRRSGANRLWDRLTGRIEAL